MPKPPSDGSYINASANELRSSEVPEIVKANRWSSNLITNPDEERCDVVRPEWVVPSGNGHPVLQLALRPTHGTMVCPSMGFAVG